MGRGVLLLDGLLASGLLTLAAVAAATLGRCPTESDSWLHACLLLVTR